MRKVSCESHKMWISWSSCESWSTIRGSGKQMPSPGFNHPHHTQTHTHTGLKTCVWANEHIRSSEVAVEFKLINSGRVFNFIIEFHPFLSLLWLDNIMYDFHQGNYIGRKMVLRWGGTCERMDERRGLFLINYWMAGHYGTFKSDQDQRSRGKCMFGRNQVLKPLPSSFITFSGTIRPSPIEASKNSRCGLNKKLLLLLF